MKADEKALSEFPYSDNLETEQERRKARVFYAMGYYQAEKDFALIPEDMGVIFNLVRKCQSRFGSGDAAYEEALRLFNKARNK